MLELVDFGRVKDDLSCADFMHVYPVVARRFIWSTHDQTPCVLILTNKCIYYGGVKSTKNKFYRIMFEDVVDVSLGNMLHWKSIKLEFKLGRRQKAVHICPLKETGERLEADLTDMKELHNLILENKKNG